MDNRATLKAFMQHGGITEDTESGFLAMFRPYHGLDEDKFHQMMQTLRALAPDLQDREQIDADLMNALWSIQTYTHEWVLYPQGMLRRNRLISEAELERVYLWMSLFSWTVANLLQGMPVEEAFRNYQDAFPNRQHPPS